MSHNKIYKIACVGDSITKGYGLEDPSKDSYPAILQRLMGERCNIGNFGVNGATVLRNTHCPYAISTECETALEWNPDIVVLELGANDILYIPMQEESFILDYKCIIEAFKVQPATQVCLTSLTPILGLYGLNFTELNKRHQTIQELLRQLAKTYSLPMIDIFTPIEDALNSQHPVLQDGIHPSARGANILAESINSAIAAIIDA